MSPVRRFALALLVAVLTFSASGISSVVIAEPCLGFEQTGPRDAACPPTCVTCGCCAQAVEPASLQVEITPEDPIVEIHPTALRLPLTQPREVLHVPKTRLV